jgi:hypothetical protein
MKKSPMPDKKQIVLKGCPIVVVKPKPPKSQPRKTDKVESMILLVFVIVEFVK